MKKRQKTTTAMSLSLLDMLFSTFGGVILLAFVFSALIIDRPVVSNKPFYLLSATLEADFAEDLPSERVSSDLQLVLKDTQSDAAVVSSEGFLVNRAGTGLLEAHGDKLSFFVMRDTNEPGKVIDRVSIVYAGQAPRNNPLTFKLSSPGSLYNLCLPQVTGITVTVREQIGNDRKPPRRFTLLCRDLWQWGNLLQSENHSDIPARFLPILTD